MILKRLRDASERNVLNDEDVKRTKDTWMSIADRKLIFQAKSIYTLRALNGMNRQTERLIDVINLYISRMLSEDLDDIDSIIRLNNVNHNPFN